MSSAPISPQGKNGLPRGLGLHGWTASGGGLWRPLLWTCCQVYPVDAMPPIPAEPDTRTRLHGNEWWKTLDSNQATARLSSGCSTD